MILEWPWGIFSSYLFIFMKFKCAFVLLYSVLALYEIYNDLPNSAIYCFLYRIFTDQLIEPRWFQFKLKIWIYKEQICTPATVVSGNVVIFTAGLVFLLINLICVHLLFIWQIFSTSVNKIFISGCFKSDFKDNFPPFNHQSNPWTAWK